MYIVLFGPPGAGKGTQAVRLAQAARLAHVATGDMFRDNLRARTALGQRAESYLTKGELVPDELTIGLLMDRLDQPDAAAGVIFDGFPRTIPQAQALDRALHARGKGVGVAALIEVANAEVLRRLGGRWTCSDCGMVFHERTNPPERDGICQRCGKLLMQRSDDTPAAIENRLRVYRQQTEPLVAFYEAAGILTRVDGEREPEAVQADLLRVLEAVSA
ncbi:MAG: adenylate kinase [Chloroflexi bacterium]|nr:adenylate kinase [Chloroflexota bacterium]